jgi:hypothetical protein
MNSAEARGSRSYIGIGFGRFQLHLHPSLLTMPLMLGVLACVLARDLSSSVLAAACVGYLAVLLLHEAAHAAVAAALGSRRVEVWLGGMGGVCVPALPSTAGVGAVLLFLSAGWWAQLALAGVALLLWRWLPGPWAPAAATLVLVWLPWNGIMLAKSMLPIGASDGAQVLAMLRALRAERLSRSG